MVQYCSTYDTVSCAHAAQRLWKDSFVVGCIFLVVEGREAVLATKILHDAFSIWSQDDVLRP